MDIYVILWHGEEEWIDELSFRTEKEAETHAGICLTQMEFVDCDYIVVKTTLA